MKIKDLKIVNIASIEHAYIDFASSPLADDSLFLITGDTGTGKTMILNAICLALYDEVPCLDAIGTGENDREGIRTDSPRQLMRRGVGSAEVLLRFEGNDGRNYCAEWSLARARKKVNGKMQAVKRTLECEETHEVYTKQKDIEDIVMKAVGLDFAQFTRTTMLAQGQFATFMKANNNDKSAILEKLTGTEIYAEIGREVYALLQAKTQEVKEIENQIDAQKPLSDDEKAQITNRSAELAKRIDALANTGRLLDIQINWLRQAEALKSQTAKTQAELQSLIIKRDSDENRQRRSTIAAWDATAEVRQWIGERAKQQRDMRQLRDDMAALSGARYMSLLAGIKWLEDQRNDCRDRKAAADAEIDREQPHAQVLANAVLIQDKADNMAKAQRDEQSLAKKCTSNAKELEQQKARESQAKVQLDQALQVTADKQTVEQEAKQRIEGVDLMALSTRVQECANRIEQADAAIAAIDTYAACRQAQDQGAQLLAKAAEELAQTQQRIKDNQNRLPAAKEERDKWENEMEGLKEINSVISDLRKRYASHHVCPLCGNDHAQIHDDETLGAAYADAKAHYEAAKKTLDELNAQIKADQAAEKAQKRTWTNCKADKDQKDSATQKAHEELAKIGEFADLDQEKTRWTQQKSQAQEQKQVASKEWEEGNRRIAEHQRALSLWQEAQKAKEQAQEEWQRQNSKTVACEAEMKHVELLREQAAKEAAEHLQAMQQLVGDGWTLTMDTARDVAADICQRAKRLDQLKRDADKYARQGDSIEATIGNCRDNMSQWQGKFEPTGEVKAVKNDNIESDIRQFGADVHRLEGNIQTLAKSIDELQVQIDGYFASNDEYTPEQIDQLSKLSKDEVSDMRQASTRLQDACVSAQGALAAIQEQMAQHALTRPQMPEDANVDEITKQKTMAEHERDAAMQERAECQRQLLNDEQLALKIADKKAELERLRHQRNNWELLDRAFGGADGKRFRNVAQSYVLRALLHKANYYLGMLNNRYRLDCEDGSLTINVIDSHHGDAVRNVGLLSGGESFVVSLSLALGLSAISKDRINVDTLFIDEGFGTLDKNVLEVVIDTLTRLHQLGGRRIGIISHVEALKERITTQVQLRRTGPSSSEVVIVSR